MSLVVFFAGLPLLGDDVQLYLQAFVADLALLVAPADAPLPVCQALFEAGEEVLQRIYDQEEVLQVLVDGGLTHG